MKILEIYLQFFENFESEFKIIIKYEVHLAKIENFIINNITFGLSEQFQIHYLLMSFEIPEI